MKAINELLSIMKTLRDPDTGCPWDRTQTIDSIAPFTLEEAYEVLESIENRDMDSLCDELGDLLFHIVFYSEMADESGDFNFQILSKRLADKLRRRHPHVFDGKKLESHEALARSWEAIKQGEREKKRSGSGGLLDDIGHGMPAMLRAEKLQKRAASVGFDWPEPGPVVARVEEELAELKADIGACAPAGKLAEELGDLLFSCVNLARHLDLAAETALRYANRKFEARFDYIEKKLQENNKSLQEASLEEMDALWEQSKEQERL